MTAVAQIPYVHVERHLGGRRKYPFAQLRAIGDFFDVPTRKPNGLQNACSNYARLSGRWVRTFTLSTGVIRAMLVEIEPGAQ